MKRIRIDARLSDIETLTDVLHHFVEHDKLDQKQADCLEALKLALVEAEKRKKENELTIIKYYDNR